MSELIRVPDIGSGEGEVIELFVKVGDTVEADQSILTLESDKASIEIPAPKAGVVKSLKVKLGDRLKEGDELLELEIEGAADAAPAAAAPAAAPAPAAEKPAAAAEAPAAPAAAPAAETVQDIHVPDIGSSGKAKIIELLVKVGDTVEADQSLITLESDKASMEIPSPAAGVVESIAVKLEDEVGTGDFILKLKVAGASAPAAAAPAAAAPAAKAEAAPAATAPAPAAKAEAAPAPAAAPAPSGAKVHAGPAVRQLAREFGVELSAVTASGPHGRVLKEDVQVYVKSMMQKAKEAPAAGAATGGSGIPPIRTVDFSRFGEI
ncbi:MAG: biotin/lipoyl-containing protein, partial [Pseudomonas sp.]